LRLGTGDSLRKGNRLLPKNRGKLYITRTCMHIRIYDYHPPKYRSVAPDFGCPFVLISRRSDISHLSTSSLTPLSGVVERRDMHIQVINYPRTALMSPSLGAWSLAISSLASPSPFPDSPGSPVSRSFPESRRVEMEGSEMG
jgi:hypothetical protein